MRKTEAIKRARRLANEKQEAVIIYIDDDSDTPNEHRIATESSWDRMVDNGQTEYEWAVGYVQPR